MRQAYITLISLLFISFHINAQGGPGGVGNASNNGLWLKADAINQSNNTSVSDWPDRSGNNNNGVQATANLQPTYFSTSALNGMPIVRLDGSNDQLIIPDADILDGSSGITFYAVVRPNNLSGNPRGILGKRTTFNVKTNYAYTWFFWSGNRLYNDVNTNDDRYDTGSITYSNSNNYILSFDYDGTLPTGQRSRMMENRDITVISSEGSATLVNSSEDLVLGALNENYGTYLGADYAELIHYNFSFDSLEHTIVSNYLSAKYNIPLGSHDLYVQDNPGNGNFDFDVAGIGRIGSSIHNNAKGCSILRISNPSGLDDNEYLFWGHDNNAQVATNTSDVPPSVDARFERVWRVSEVNGTGGAIDVGAINLEWDLTGFSAVTASDLALLVDTNNDGSFADEAPITGASTFRNGVFSFNGITAIEDGLRFTLGTLDQQQTSLPVEYHSFTGFARNTSNVLTWVTSTEVDNDFFSIEKRDDKGAWETIGKVNSERGNSNTILSYQWTDRNITLPTSYYRLKQTDLNGSFSYSKTISVVNRLKDEISIYPNPALDHIYINSSSDEAPRIFRSDGSLLERTLQKIDKGFGIQIDISDLDPGLYFLKMGEHTIPFVKQ